MKIGIGSRNGAGDGRKAEYEALAQKTGAGDVSDPLHPNDAGYRITAERLARTITELAH